MIARLRPDLKPSPPGYRPTMIGEGWLGLGVVCLSERAGRVFRTAKKYEFTHAGKSVQGNLLS